MKNTVNPQTIIGENCNIHKGVTIGKENRGKRERLPIIIRGLLFLEKMLQKDILIICIIARRQYENKQY